MKKLLFLLTFLCFACGDDDSITPEVAVEETGNNGSVQDWLIPQNQVFDGGPGQDGIPSVDDPQFSTVSQADFLNDDDLIVGIAVNGETRAYPHKILDWHEIVNDELGGLSYAITYCPLTGTAITWDREVDGSITEFGVSGKLYNTNLLPYDRNTGSYWSQIRLECVNGDLVGTDIRTIPVFETTWGTWKEAYPNTEVLNTDTGFSRNYQQFPYGDYRTNHDNIIFPVNPLDSRLPSKERVLGVLSEDTNRAYSIELFEEDALIVDEIDNREIFVVGSKDKNFVLAFETGELDNPSLLVNQLPLIAEDAAGNVIDFTGRVVDGPLAGQQLAIPNSFIGYYFSLAAFYPGIEIYQ